MSYSVFYKKSNNSLRKAVVYETSEPFSEIKYLPDVSGQISSGSSIYESYGLGARTSGTFPSYSDPSTLETNNVETDSASNATFFSSSASSSIYTDGVKSSFLAYVGNSSKIDIDADETITFCTSDQKDLPITISYTSSNNAIEIQFINSNSYYTLYINQSLAGLYLVEYDGYIGLCAYTIDPIYESGSWSTRMYAGVSGFRYTEHTNTNPFRRLLESYNAIYGASGSSDDDSEGAGSSGGDGDYDFSNSNITSDDDMPTSSPAIAAGLLNPYYVTAGEIASLGNFLWSSDFFDSIAKTFSNPMDCIISLSSFPLASSSISLGSSESVRVGNTTSSSTGTRLISEFVTIDCGSVSVPEVWGSYLDYAQTKLYIYIPYLGIEELPLCECMGGSVACTLRINLLTGALVACVTLTSGTYITGTARVQPIYFSTTCKSDIPVSGATTGALAGAFQLLGGAVSSVAGIATGTAPLAISGLASAAQGVATMQSQNSQISGAVGAAGGQMAHKIPFLIFDRPVQSVPANLASIAGYQSNSGTTLSRCSGYVICDTINLDGLALTRSELEEVERICTSGVYIS